ncbi:hypothetical protein M409DRAFT_55728 [Zasmidium cellare ATCC 36951]|uniref:Uncharacterized protein n=1 Tax=Zasmidium cellare ATCC 36951 TaxID=1080233 RepID=A0A6A6CGJ7_ZASCE|nr:uncharacterized protein M409DRAFT_55728 [Zasmidium cellare ATCC 36951]KAF2165310.1 hypothetical protein M409DRAFT_55728 [Zasmidium cellare ATCC 36951]
MAGEFAESQLPSAFHSDPNGMLRTTCPRHSIDLQNDDALSCTYNCFDSSRFVKNFQFVQDEENRRTTQGPLGATELPGSGSNTRATLLSLPGGMIKTLFVFLRFEDTVKRVHNAEAGKESRMGNMGGTSCAYASGLYGGTTTFIWSPTTHSHIRPSQATGNGILASNQRELGSDLCREGLIPTALVSTSYFHTQYPGNCSKNQSVLSQSRNSEELLS